MTPLLLYLEKNLLIKNWRTNFRRRRQRVNILEANGVELVDPLEKAGALLYRETQKWKQVIR